MFPEDDFERILSAVKSAPNSVLEKSQQDLDSHVAEALPDYHFEQDSEIGLNPKCKLWAPKFNHSVDLYHPGERLLLRLKRANRNV